MNRAVVVAALVIACPDATPADVGRSLFEGRSPLVGRIAGQDIVLPVQASRCVNCHLDARPAPGGAAAQRLGPPLTGPSLLETVQRRGGPPSRYDSTAFCRLLRTGVDPAFVIVDRSMPRYEIDTADCEALWAHVAARH